MNIGNLKFVPVKDPPELVSPIVFGAVPRLDRAEQIQVVEIDPRFSDTNVFCLEYQIGMNRVANCVILEAKRAEKGWLAACVALGDTRIDVNGLVRRTLNARKASFASMDEAVAQSSMEYGAITPIGLPDGWPILIDLAVVHSEYVIIGSGLRKSKLAVPGNLLAFLPDACILKGVAKVLE